MSNSLVFEVARSSDAGGPLAQPQDGCRGGGDMAVAAEVLAQRRTLPRRQLRRRVSLLQLVLHMPDEVREVKSARRSQERSGQ